MIKEYKNGSKQLSYSNAKLIILNVSKRNFDNKFNMTRSIFRIEIFSV